MACTASRIDLLGLQGNEKTNTEKLGLAGLGSWMEKQHPKKLSLFVIHSEIRRWGYYLHKELD